MKTHVPIYIIEHSYKCRQKIHVIVVGRLRIPLRLRPFAAAAVLRPHCVWALLAALLLALAGRARPRTINP
jgi:hypothetical protein